MLNLNEVGGLVAIGNSPFGALSQNTPENCFPTNGLDKAGSRWLPCGI